MLGIPSPDSPTFGRRVREALQRLLGQSGDPLSGVVTFHDLINVGVVTPTGSFPRAPGSPGAGLVTNNPSYDRTPPPKPVAVSIDVAYLRAFVQWSVPDYGNHAYSEVWRAPADDLTQAVLHQQVTGNPQALAEVTVQFGESWYYWVRLISRAGVPGPWHSTSGLHAEGPVNVEAVLTDLGESLDLSFLSQSTQDSINSIPGIQSQLEQLQGTTAAQVFVDASKPLPGVDGVPDPIPASARWYDSDDNNAPHLWNWDSVRSSAFQWAAVSGSIWRLEAAAGGDPGISEPDALVEYDGADETTQSRIADDTLPGASGEWSWYDTGSYSTIYWDRASDPDGLTADYVRAYRWLSLLDPRVGVNEANISSLQSDMTTAQGDISATSSALSALETTVTNLSGTVSSQSTSITNLSSRLDTAELDIGSLETTASANSSAISSLTSRVSATEGSISAQSSDITSLESDLSDVRSASGANLLDGDPSAELVGTTTYQPDYWQDKDLADQYVDIVPGDKIVLSADVWSENHSAQKGVLLIIYNESYGQVAKTESNLVTGEGWHRVETPPTTVPETAKWIRVEGFFQDANGVDQNKVRRWMLNLGESASAFSTNRPVTSRIDANASAVGSLQTRVTNTEGSISSISSDVTALESSLSTAEGTISAQGSAISALQTDTSQIEGDLSVISSKLDIVEAGYSSDSMYAPYGDMERYDVGSRKAVNWIEIGVGHPDVAAYAPPGTNLTRSMVVRRRDSYFFGAGVRVAPGEYLRVAGWIDNSSPGQTNAAGFGYRFDTPAGAIVTWSRAVTIPAGQGWTYLEGSVVVPAGASKAYPWIQINGPGSTVLPSVYLADLSFSRGASATATAILEANVTAIDGAVTSVQARQGVRLDVNGYVTGYIQNNDGQQGDFVIMADRFAVVAPGGSPVVPFAVVGTETFIDTARIQNGSIADAKIGDLSADKIVTGRMSANRIFGGTIDGNNVNVTNISASNITTGTLSASIINLDGLTLENNGGKLQVKSGGIDTGQLVDNAVSRLYDGSDPDGFWASQASATWQNVVSVQVTTTGKKLRVHASTLIERLIGTSATSCAVRVLRDGVDVTYSSNALIFLWGTQYTNPWAVNFPDQPAAGTYTYTLQIKPTENIQLFLTHPTLIVDEFKK